MNKELFSFQAAIYAQFSTGVDMGRTGDDVKGVFFIADLCAGAGRVGSRRPVVGHDGSNQGWKSAFLALPDEGEGIVILTNAETGKGLVEEVKCRWVAWATGGTIPPCLNRHLMQDALVATGIWLAIVLAVLLRARARGRVGHGNQQGLSGFRRGRPETTKQDHP